MPKLYIENGADRGKSYLIQKDKPFYAGRDKAAQVVLSDEMASRRHFQIEHRDAKFSVRDLDSSNGTFLNGSLVRGVEPLAPNDRIQVGSTLITFQTDEPHPLIGREISGYRILDRIGRGGMGTVYRALQTSLDRVVALKVLAPHLVKNTNFVNLFIREARSAGALSHPNIVQVYDVGVQEDIYFFSMEYIPEGSVEDLLNRHGPIPLARALRLVHDAAQGLQYAEQVGIIHRDIKPGNLMIGTGGVVKIGDLGISRTTEGAGQASQKDGVSGSPHYIAPEQARGFDIDGRVDIYSLGCSFYQVLSGTTPFRGSTPREVILKHLKEDPQPVGDRVEGLPSDVARLVHHMMAKNAAERVRGAGELIQLLEPVLRKYPDESSGDVAPAKSFGLGKLLALVATVLILVGVGGGAMVLKVKNDQRKKREVTRKETASKTIERLWSLVSAENVSGFEAEFAALDREQFDDEEWSQVEQAKAQSETTAKEQKRTARLVEAKRELARLIEQGESQLSAATESPWPDRVTLMESLATGYRAFSQTYADLDNESVLTESDSRSTAMDKAATQLRSHEEASLSAFDRLSPRAEGSARAGNFKSARAELDKFDVKRFAGTSGHRQQLDALQALRGNEAVEWERRTGIVAEQIATKKYNSAILSLESFLGVIAFAQTRSKVEARIAEIESLKEDEDGPGGDEQDQRKAILGITKAWRTWAAKLELSAIESGELRDLRFAGGNTKLRDLVRGQADLLDSWPQVLRNLDERGVDRMTLGLASGDVEVRELRLDGKKIRYSPIGGNRNFSLWSELSDAGRVALLTRLATSPEEKLFAGLLGLVLDQPTAASTAAFKAALVDKRLSDPKKRAAGALEDLLDP